MVAKIAGYFAMMMGLAAFAVGLVESLPGMLQIGAYVFVNLVGTEYMSLLDVARACPAVNFLPFHGLPSGIAAPLFLVAGGFALVGGAYMDGENGRCEEQSSTGIQRAYIRIDRGIKPIRKLRGRR